MEEKPIREVRQELGYSQRDLADALQVAISSVSRWERGKHRPHRWVRLRLAQLRKARSAQHDR